MEDVVAVALEGRAELWVPRPADVRGRRRASRGRGEPLRLLACARVGSTFQSRSAAIVGRAGYRRQRDREPFDDVEGLGQDRSLVVISVRPERSCASRQWSIDSKPSPSSLANWEADLAGLDNVCVVVRRRRPLLVVAEQQPAVAGLRQGSSVYARGPVRKTSSRDPAPYGTALTRFRRSSVRANPAERRQMGLGRPVTARSGRSSATTYARRLGYSTSGYGERPLVETISKPA